MSGCLSISLQRLIDVVDDLQDEGHATNSKLHSLLFLYLAVGVLCVSEGQKATAASIPLESLQQLQSQSLERYWI